MEFWLNGLPWLDIQNATSPGETKYWLGGLPYVRVYSSAAPPASAFRPIIMWWF